MDANRTENLQVIINQLKECVDGYFLLTVNNATEEGAELASACHIRGVAEQSALLTGINNLLEREPQLKWALQMKWFTDSVSGMEGLADRPPDGEGGDYGQGR